MKRRGKNGSPIRMTSADIAKLSPAVRAKLGISEAQGAKGKEQRLKAAKPKRSSERTYQISWYAPVVGRRVTYNRPVAAANKEGAIREVRAWLRSMSFREHKGATNFIAKEMARKTNSKKVSSSRPAAVGRKTNRTARKKNLFGFGKKAKRKRSAKLRKKADVLQAKANLLRARSKNKGGTKAAHKTNPAEIKPFAIKGRHAAALITKNVGNKYVGELISSDGGRFTVDKQGRRYKTFLTFAGAKKWGREMVARFDKMATGPRTKNPPLWADIIGGLAGGAGYATAAAWVSHKLDKSKKRTSSKRAENKSQKKAKRARNTPSTARLYNEFQGRPPQGKVLKLLTPAGTPKDMSMIGPLIEIRLKNRPNEPIKFSATDRGALANPKAYLCQAQRGPSRRVYVGMVRPFGRMKNGAAIEKAIDFGPALSIAYWAKKPHLGHQKMTAFEHEFGDRGGRQPNVVLCESGLIDLRGGDYTVMSGGIDN